MTTVVLGAGVVGVATAWYLSKAGHDVEVVERQPSAQLHARTVPRQRATQRSRSMPRSRHSPATPQGAAMADAT